MPLLGSPVNTSFGHSLSAQGIIFSILVSTTEDVNNYISHYHAIISFFRTLSASPNAVGICPVVLFTSGCKDYGPGLLKNDPYLSTHTELSPLNPPSLANRANHAIKMFENMDLFDAVSDYAEAYVALCQAKRKVVAGHCYNISTSSFETIGAILRAWVNEYCVEQGMKFAKMEGRMGPRAVLMGFSQWVGSGKVRRDTG